jgi:plastocyanin
MPRIRVFAWMTAVLACLGLGWWACSGGGDGYGSSPTAPSAPKTVIVEVRDNSYEPKSVTIEPGDTVRWVMAGSDATHTVTARDGSFNSGTTFTRSGATFERQFQISGRTIEYSCQAHADCCEMKGSVRVGRDAPDPVPGY